MDYLEQYYKNRTIQLQQELEQLTETYEYRLNEAAGLGDIIRRVFGFGGDDVGRVIEREAINAVPAVRAPVMSAAQREAAARARQAAIAAARVAAREARESVFQTLLDIHPDNWMAWFNSPTTTQTQRDAYRLLFPNGAVSGNLPGHGMVTFQRINDGGRVRVLWWDDANDRWRWVGKNTNTPAGNVGPQGFVPSGKTAPHVSTMIDTIDPSLQNTQLASTRPGIGSSNGSGLGSNGSGLGSVAALYMSYDPRSVSRKINYITENYYRN
jgi:hypothetical protein